MSLTRTLAPWGELIFILASVALIFGGMILSSWRNHEYLPNRQLMTLETDLRNIIHTTCSNCQEAEIVWDYHKTGLTAEFNRKNGPCPIVTVDAHFLQLGIARHVIAVIDGQQQTPSIGDVFRSCQISWQVQTRN